MPDDPLDTNLPANRPDPNPPISRRGCTCEFCDCQLAPSGEVLRMGDKAKNFRRHEEVVEKKDAEISRLQAEITDLKAKLQAAQGSSGSGSSGSRSVGRLIEG